MNDTHMHDHDMPDGTEHHDGHDQDHGAHNNNDTLPDDHSNHMMHGMSPYLFTRTTDFFILFKEADVQSTGGFIGALVGSFVFALLATLFSLVMHVHEKKALERRGNPGNSIVAALLFGMRQLLHYAAMLIVMTMNVWVILVVVAGHSVGWLMFKIVIMSRAGKQSMPMTTAQKEQDVDTHDP